MKSMVFVAWGLILAGAYPVYAVPITVNDLSDDGISTTTGTLRGAIAQANASGDLDTIVFNIPGGNSITVMAPLLISGGPVVINGGRTQVVGAANSSMDVFEIVGAGSGSVISNLAIVNGKFGVFIGCDYNSVTGCAIGTDWADSPGKGNSDGIHINGGTHNQIGCNGPMGLGRNIISGNTNQGIYATNTRYLTVSSNYIGLKSDGVNPLKNNGNGITLFANTQQAFIGGSLVGDLNVISGNGSFGIQLNGQTVQGNTVCGNIIGLNAGQSSPVPNTYGIMITDACGNYIGMAQQYYSNIISGNSPQAGISFQTVGARPRLNVVRNNIIGTNWAGASGLGNNTFGILMDGDANLIGGRLKASWYEGNIISGNITSGINITGSGNTVSGNCIGTSADGTAGLPNNGNGINLSAGNGNAIGGPNADVDTCRGNLISGNTLGMGISVTGGHDHVIIGNLVGTNLAGSAPLPNGRGIYLFSDSARVTIGGAAFAQRNVISGNSNCGIYFMEGSTCSSFVIQGNYLGISADGTAAVANGGVQLYNGGLAGSLISGNYIYGTTGIKLNGAGTSGNTLTANRIGLLPNQSIPTPAMTDGIYIQGGSQGNWIGQWGGDGNIVVNATNGITIWDSTSIQNGLYGNTLCGCSSPITLANNANHSDTFLPPRILGAVPNTVAGDGAQQGDTIEIFAADRTEIYSGGSLRYLGSKTVTLASGGWTITGLTGLAGGERVTAIRSDTLNNSSAFSVNCYVVPFTPTTTPTSSMTATATMTPTSSPTRTASPTSTDTPTFTATPTSTPTATRSVTFTPSPTVTATPTRTSTCTSTRTATVSPTAVKTATTTPTPSPTVGAMLSTRTATPLAVLPGAVKAYPNPGQNRIRFAIGQEGQAMRKVVLYNLAGEHIAEVGADGLTGIIEWDCSRVAPGIYIARVVINGHEFGKLKVAVVR